MTQEEKFPLPLNDLQGHENIIAKSLQQVIETIDILKEESSAAVFGARSSTGVLMITTKKGATDKPFREMNF